MASVREKRVSCGICSSMKSVSSTTTEFDFGKWKELSVESEDGGKKMFICDGCLNIFRALFDEWYDSKKPKVPKTKPKVTKTK